MRRLIGEALAVVVVCTVVALSVNAVRADSIPLIATTPYKIFVPCPEPKGEVEQVEADAVRWGDRAELVVDARAVEDFEAWHAPGAHSVPYDFLDPVPPEAVEALLSSGGARVVVYGDPGPPDTGEALAGELSAAGMTRVHWVVGGVEAVREAVRP